MLSRQSMGTTLVRAGLLAALTLVTACGESLPVTVTAAPEPLTVTVVVQGLPAGRQATLYADRPAQGGGYLRGAQLGSTAGSLQLQVNRDAFVEAELISGGGGDLWEPEERFQQVPQAGATLTFTYVHKFMVTVSTWSHGPLASPSFAQLGVMGEVRPSSGWFRDGESIDFQATPQPGWRFAHWGVFAPGEQMDQTRLTSSAPTLHVVVNGPLSVMGGFLPAQ